MAAAAGLLAALYFVLASSWGFMTGTAAHVTPVVELDRRTIGSGKMGPVTTDLIKLYFEIITGKNAKYADWCTPCYSKVKA